MMLCQSTAKISLVSRRLQSRTKHESAPIVPTMGETSGAFSSLILGLVGTGSGTARLLQVKNIPSFYPNPNHPADKGDQ